MLKEELRKRYLQKRIDLTDEEKDHFNAKIKAQFESHLPIDVKTVHVYLPIPSKGEPDTWEIIRWLWLRNIKVAVPVMDQKKALINSYELTEKTQLKVNGWQIPEPVHSSVFKKNKIDAVIVPLLSFDYSGNRVGYGKGFYDAFLGSLNNPVIKIGISYFPPVDKISNPDPWDIPLDFCITPRQTFKF